MEQLLNQNPWLFWLLILLILWSLPWKAMALWRAAKRDQKIWFVIFILFNTVGLLEIVYLFFLSGPKGGEPKKEEAAFARPERPLIV